MKNKEEIDALMMFARIMSGEKNIVEHMESEGQQYAVSNTMMAKRMRPSIEEWENLGFRFTDIPGDSVLCEATMPEGWSMRATSHSMWNEIIDENGMKRGSMFYKAAFYDRSAHMMLEHRYGVCTIYVDEEQTTREVYFGDSNEKLFVAGQVYMSGEESREEAKAKYEELDRLEDLARKYGDENYPDWRNVHAYWDNDKVLAKGISK